ncbi:MAG: D-threonate/D-erythronate kinase [Candidatus Petromonas sp.]|jgi:uncharacterized protein YgbK (DUF1537 family)|nr:D-threonate/D-erythronate kinase [Candidatus Petromonas sp.]
MMSKKLVVIADDFTGSNDTGVQFSKKGLRTVVVSNLDFLNEALSNCDVLVVDTESRFDDKDKAYDKTYHVGSFAKENKVDYVYKKLDSTFRGNIGGEIAGTIDAMGIDLAIVAPAFPSAGRKTVEGNVYVHDVLLEKTEIAKDPKTPVRESSIPKIISQQSDKNIAVISREIVLKGKEVLNKEIMRLKEKSIEIVVVDAINNDDLKTIAEAIALVNQQVLMVGSAGLAEFLPDTLKLKDTKKSIAVIVGSVSDITRRQANYAVEKYYVEEIIINIENIFNSDRENEKERILNKINELIRLDKDIIIRSTQTVEDVKKAFDIGEKFGLSSFEVSDKIALFIGELTKEMLNNTKLDGLMLTGGDIAIKTANMLGVSGTIIENEILPGIPYGYFIHDTFGEIPIVTKAGGFGEEDAIVKIIDYLKKEF